MCQDLGVGGRGFSMECYSATFLARLDSLRLKLLIAKTINFPHVQAFLGLALFCLVRQISIVRISWLSLLQVLVGSTRCALRLDMVMTENSPLHRPRLPQAADSSPALRPAISPEPRRRRCLNKRLGQTAVCYAKGSRSGKPIAYGKHRSTNSLCFLAMKSL